MPKCRNAKCCGSINGSQNPCDRRLTSNRDFTISRFGVLKDKSLYPSTSRYPKSQNERRETLTANLLAALPDPTACGVSVFPLEGSPPSVQISKLSSWIYAGLKPVLLPSIGWPAGISTSIQCSTTFFLLSFYSIST
jgi:hypothetical protein